MGTLFLISTPIGNLEDISIRALKTLWQLDVLLCEDTREASTLLNHYRQYKTDIEPQLKNYTDFNHEQQISMIISELEKGKKVGLISDRGTPLISDPGYRLVAHIVKLIKLGSPIRLESIPGASAANTALQLSGFAPNQFFFAGFLSKNASVRKKALEAFPKTTIILYESPQRLVELLSDALAVFGDISCAVCRELTKVHEEVYRGALSEAISHFTDTEPMGEITVVLDGHDT